MKINCISKESIDSTQPGEVYFTIDASADVFEFYDTIAPIVGSDVEANIIPVVTMKGPFRINPEIYRFIPKYDRVIFSGPCTIVIWDNGTKTMVRCSDDDSFDPVIGLTLCFLKKFVGEDEYKHLKKNIFKEVDKYYEKE